MKAYGLTNKGLVRKGNEDDYLCCQDRGLFVVADGMGGHAAGEVASSLAIQEVKKYICTDKELIIPEDLERAVLKANEAIYNKSKEEEECNGMGTTLTVAKIHQAKLWVTHVGDSRIYLVRNNEIKLLTEDHSLVAELVKKGKITESEAKLHPQKNMLTRAIGTQAIVNVDVFSHEIQKEDLIILCTDGLSNLVDSQQMMETLLNQSIEKGVKKLVDKALDRGGHDNITLIAVEY
ncbi:protein phosphatase [Desulfitispora alkaliphila]|uniref:Stp1/IreP family PP2C-type Ser/Thr phosphatase n=1 Tax=Desulfitispora alkaliphila TaxID=622674 RepID=UPI003D1F4758